jgi:hypothetical protein
MHGEWSFISAANTTHATQSDNDLEPMKLLETKVPVSAAIQMLLASLSPYHRKD